MASRSKESLMQAEQSTIGGIFLDPGSLKNVAPIVGPGDFADRRHRSIFAAVLAKAQKGQPIDIVTVGEEPNIDLGYLAEITKNTPSAANIQSYAEIVKDESQKRSGRGLINEAKSRIDGGGDVNEVINWLRSETEPIKKNSGGLSLSGSWTGLDYHTIATRPYVLDPVFMRKAVSILSAPGGVGKSSCAISLGIVAATGKPILGNRFKTVERVNVAIINNEDSMDEITRRVAAITVHSGLELNDLDGKLFVFSGESSPFRVSHTMPDRLKVTTQHVEELKKLIRDLGIGAVIVDPVISTHDSEENSNGEMDRVAGIYRSIAYETNSAFLLVQHTRKMGGDSEMHAGNPEASRGAGALINSCRAAFTLAAMSKSSAEKYNFGEELRRRLRRFDDAKGNYSLPDESATWFKMASFCLDNGTEDRQSDWVGVLEPFDFETAAALAEMECEGRGRKWTAHGFAAVLNEFCIEQPDPSNVYWSDIKVEVCSKLSISKSSSSGYLALVSTDPERPTRIKTLAGQLVEFWTEKSGTFRTAKTVIRRQEL